MYSFGILLWQLVSGELVPYAKLTVSQVRSESEWMSGKSEGQSESEGAR